MTIYIHERQGWPQFEWTSQSVTGYLAAVRYQQGRLSGRMEALGSELRAEAISQTLTEDVVTSGALDGDTLDRESVLAAVSRCLADHGALKPEKALLTSAGSSRAGSVWPFIDAAGHCQAPVTLERLFGWHAALLPDGTSNGILVAVGTLREGPVRTGMQYVGSARRARGHLYAPEAAQLRIEIVRFLEWFNSDAPLDPVLKAAIAHLWFLALQPFEAGNGGLARVLSDLMLARAEGGRPRFYSLSAQLCREHKAYALALERARKASLDITPWLQWFFACLTGAFASAEDLLAHILRKARFREALPRQDLSVRQRFVIEHLLEHSGGTLAVSDWATLANTSKDTALRDINDLLARGLLLKKDAGGRSSRYRLPALKLD